ncbi:MAG: hypothetical protein HKM28_07995 [Flavobacteriaceae bacterium]|nr:hypothetical protein [Flavobacteriaceae bacterium]
MQQKKNKKDDAFYLYGFEWTQPQEPLKKRRSKNTTSRNNITSTKKIA